MSSIYRNQQFYRTQIIGSMMFNSAKSISRKKPNVDQYVYEYQPFIHYILIPRVFGLIVIFCILEN
jgi:hypothetical protein